MDIRGKKNKGNRAVKKVIEYFSRYLDIDKSFLYSTASSVKGRDITIDRSISNIYPFSIEVKNQETMDFNSWWLQTLKNTNELIEKPLLIFTRNRDILRVAFNNSDFECYYQYDGCIYTRTIPYIKYPIISNLKVPTWKYITEEGVYTTRLFENLIVIMPLNNFLEDYKKKIIKNGN